MTAIFNFEAARLARSPRHGAQERAVIACDRLREAIEFDAPMATVRAVASDLADRLAELERLRELTD